MANDLERIAVDNDAVIKAVSYGLADLWWPSDGDRACDIGVLGAARFVARNTIEDGRVHGIEAAHAALSALLDAAEQLDPTDDEVDFAAELERVAQQQDLPFDGGESQLCAMTVRRGLAGLDTGDKRAIASLETLLGQFDALEYLVGRVRCLEQVALHSLAGDPEANQTVEAVCAEPNVDKTMSICCSCTSGSSPGRAALTQALESYIRDVVRSAPRAMV